VLLLRTTGIIAGTAAIAVTLGAVTIAATLRQLNNFQNKNGEPGGSPFFANLPCRLGSALNARMFHERLAPQERCVQLYFSSKPGGVMSPPELNELTPPVYSLSASIASEDSVNPEFHRLVFSYLTGDGLLDEEGFAELIPAHE
jgi:hypothetical protein